MLSSQTRIVIQLQCIAWAHHTRAATLHSTTPTPNDVAHQRREVQRAQERCACLRLTTSLSRPCCACPTIDPNRTFMAVTFNTNAIVTLLPLPSRTGAHALSCHLLAFCHTFSHHELSSSSRIQFPMHSLRLYHLPGQRQGCRYNVGWVQHATWRHR